MQGTVPPTRFVTLYGLAAHAHRMAAAALVLLEHDLVLEAIPSVRAAYECALTAHWILRVEDATVDFLRESHRQRGTLLSTARQALPGLDHRQADAVAAEFSHDAGTAEQAAKHMRSRCDDLEPGGAEAYLHYRALSALSHASHYIVDQYLDLPEGAPAPTLRRAPKPQDPSSWLYLTAASLIWAGRAVSVCDADHHRRGQLQAAARELGVQLDLGAAADVWLRQQQARQQRAAKHRPEQQPSAGPRSSAGPHTPAGTS